MTPDDDAQLRAQIYDGADPDRLIAVPRRNIIELLAEVERLSQERDAAVNAAEFALTERIVARIMRIANAQKPNHRRYRAFHAGLLVAAGEAKVERLYEPDEPDLPNEPIGWVDV